jgi:hypothetical protein
MTVALHMAHWLAGVVVLAEALNKLERTAPFAPGLRPRERLVDGLKALAWALLAIGGGGAIVTPLLPLERPTLQDVCLIVGFAVLIVRTRIKEG